MSSLRQLIKVSQEYLDALDDWASPTGGQGHQEARLNRAEQELRHLVRREGESCAAGNTTRKPQ